VFADCGTLSAPVNGQISTGVTTYGATRTFTCTIGYVLTGASSVTCLATGKWDGSKPNCDKKGTVNFCQTLSGDIFFILYYVQFKLT